MTSCKVVIQGSRLSLPRSHTQTRCYHSHVGERNHRPSVSTFGQVKAMKLQVGTEYHRSPTV